MHLRGLAEAVKRGVLQAGGFPREFPVMSLGESLMKPTTMLYRNLMAMDVEESIRSYPLDGVVLLTGCDKTNPASILGACSANIPTIVVTGGPMLNGHWRGKELGSCSDCWHYHEELRAGPDQRAGLHRDRGLDVALERPLHDDGDRVDDGVRDRGARADAAGRRGRSRRSTRAARTSPRRRGARSSSSSSATCAPSDILTREAFENAIRALHAISGSTNAIIHLIAYAGRLGVDLPLVAASTSCARARRGSSTSSPPAPT